MRLFPPRCAGAPGITSPSSSPTSLRGGGTAGCWCGGRNLALSDGRPGRCGVNEFAGRSAVKPATCAHPTTLLPETGLTGAAAGNHQPGVPIAGILAGCSVVVVAVAAWLLI